MTLNQFVHSPLAPRRLDSWRCPNPCRCCYFVVIKLMLIFNQKVMPKRASVWLNKRVEKQRPCLCSSLVLSIFSTNGGRLLGETTAARLASFVLLLDGGVLLGCGARARQWRLSICQAIAGRVPFLFKRRISFEKSMFM